jgi:hypothetical protein
MAIFAIFIANQFSRKYSFPHNFHHDINSPILAIELSTDAKQLEAVLGTTNPAGADPAGNAGIAVASLRTNTYEDFGFIPMYTVFLWSFAVLFAIRADGSPTIHRITIAALALLIAASDCLENVGILRTLGATSLSDSMALATSWPSRGKWGLFAVALLLTGWILARSESPDYSLPTRRLLALAYGAAGILMSIGLAFPHLIELATNIFGLLVAVNIVGLLGPFFGGWFLRPNPPKYVDDFCTRKAQRQADVAIYPERS